MKNNDHIFTTLFTLFLLVFATGSISAQSSAFTYQGKLTDNGAAANGTYDIEFRLFDIASGGSAIAVQQKLNVQVVDGVFAVQLDYGAASFTGSSRYIEIGVRQAGGNSFTTMTPRSLISSTPYAIKSLIAASADTATNASQLGGVSAANFVQTNDTRLTDARIPLPGSASYIQNSTNTQAGSNFNIGGKGVANIFNAATQYEIAGRRAFAITGNDSDGVNASNTFAGTSAGLSNVPGNDDVHGNANSFFGGSAGKSNTSGYDNSIFGFHAGSGIIQGFDNSMFGYFAGAITNSGFENAFFGSSAGQSNASGSGNTLLGAYADTGTGDLSNATAIGSYAKVTKSNSLVLGRIDGNGTDIGVGTTAPVAKLHIATNGGDITFGGLGCGSGFIGIAFTSASSACTNYSLLGNGTNTYINRPTGGYILFRENNATQIVINPGGTLGVNILGSAGSTQLCRNASNQISTCSSSLRYKTNIAPFRKGLMLLDRLQPITFNWKDGGMADLGFGAEDVAKVEPLLVTHNEKGEVEGVKYDRISAVLVIAVKEQQAIIQKQQQAIDKQAAEIAELTKLVCQTHRRTQVRRGR